MMSYLGAVGVVLRVLLPAWLMDRLLGDPVSLPHPVIWFGKMIAFWEKRLNRGACRLWKGGIMAVLLILFVYSVTWGIEQGLSFLGTPAVVGFDIICIFLTLYPANCAALSFPPIACILNPISVLLKKNHTRIASAIAINIVKFALEPANDGILNCSGILADIG